MPLLHNLRQAEKRQAKMAMATSTGCRPETLINVLWAIDGDWLAQASDQVQRLMLQPESWETTLRESKSQNEKAADEPGYEVDDHGIAHIAVEGPITKYPTSFSSLLGGTSTVMTKRALREAFADDRVKAFAMHFDTPGGTVGGVAELADTIREVGKEKPVHGLVTGSCCSAGMWLASQCTSLSAEPTTEVGSVGGMVVLTDRSDNLDRQGIRRIVVKSDGAEFKGLGVDGLKINQEDIKEIKTRLDDQVKYFLADVQKGRKLSNEQMKEVRRARVYEAATAKQHGLVDHVMYTQDRIDKLHQELDAGSERGRVPASEPPPAAPRSVAMFTPEQMQRIHKLPGAEAATDANVGEVLLQVAERLNQRPEKLPSAPEAPSPEAISVKAERIELLVEKQHLTKAQGDALTKFVKDSPLGFFAQAGEKRVIDRFFEVVLMNTPTFSTGSKTSHQPEPQTSHEQKDDDEEDDKDDAEVKLESSGRKQGEDAKKAALRAKGIEV